MVRGLDIQSGGLNLAWDQMSQIHQHGPVNLLRSEINFAGPLLIEF